MKKPNDISQKMWMKINGQARKYALKYLEDVQAAAEDDFIAGAVWTLSITDVSKRIFAIKDTSGEWVKLCATKETAKKELKKYQKAHNYVDFYIDEETLY